MAKLIGRMRSQAEKTPLSMAIAMLLFALAGMSFPIKYFVDYTGELMALAYVRIAFGAVGILFMLMFGFHKSLLLGKNLKKNWDVLVVALIISINNFPVIPLIAGQFFVTASASVQAQYVVFCLSVGLFEEVFYRGLILLLLESLFANKRYKKLYATLLSSAAFGLVHLINLFGGAGIGAVLMQVGYSSLIGGMMCVVYYCTQSVLYPIVLHSLYDIGGLMSGYIGSGTLWTPTTVALTAAVAALGGGWLIFRFVRAFCPIGAATEPEAVDCATASETVESSVCATAPETECADCEDGAEAATRDDE